MTERLQEHVVSAEASPSQGATGPPPGDLLPGSLDPGSGAGSPVLLEQGQPTRAEPLLSGLRPLAHVLGQTLSKASHVFSPQRPCSPILFFLSTIPSVVFFFFFFWSIRKL